MKVIILEDEPLMALELKSEILKADSSIQILGVFDSIQATKRYLASGELPDLFFSDIHLADGLSFDIFKTLDRVVPVVFCTAYNEYALNAFNANGIDYLVKPLDSKDVEKTLVKFKSLVQTGSNTIQLSQIVNQFMANQSNEEKSAILVHKGEKIYPIKKKDIRIVHLSNGIIYLYDKTANKYLVNSTMDNLAKTLGKQSFFRANRQFIVHRDVVDHVSYFFSRKLIIKSGISFKEEIVVSKANATKFIEWLER